MPPSENSEKTASVGIATTNDAILPPGLTMKAEEIAFEYSCVSCNANAAIRITTSSNAKPTTALFLREWRYLEGRAPDATKPYEHPVLSAELFQTGPGKATFRHSGPGAHSSRHYEPRGDAVNPPLAS